MAGSYLGWILVFVLGGIWNLERRGHKALGLISETGSEIDVLGNRLKARIPRELLTTPSPFTAPLTKGCGVFVQQPRPFVHGLVYHVCSKP